MKKAWIFFGGFAVAITGFAIKSIAGEAIAIVGLLLMAVYFFLGEKQKRSEMKTSQTDTIDKQRESKQWVSNQTVSEQEHQYQTPPMTLPYGNYTGGTVENKEKYYCKRVFVPELENFRMSMHNAAGESHCFSLTGWIEVDPAATYFLDPYFDDDSFKFLCKYENEYCILEFFIRYGYAGWNCYFMDAEHAEQLTKEGPSCRWDHVSGRKILFLHPDSISDAKKLTGGLYMRKIADDVLYGREVPNDNNP